MKKFILPAIVISVSLFALALFATYGICSQSPPHSTAPKVETYLVVKVTDENKTDKKVEFKVISASQFKDEQKRLKEEYDKKYKEWQDVKKADSTAPRPIKPTIQKIGTSYKTQTGAQKVADKLRDDEAAKDNGDDKPKDAKK